MLTDLGWNYSNFAIRTVVILSISVLIFAYPQNEESLTREDKEAPQCPTPSGHRQFLRYKQDNKCYEANTKGPCGENMVLYPHPSSRNFGFCDCFDARGETEQEIEFLNSKNLSHCIREIRAQLFVPERKRCYSAFDKGPCTEGKWLVLNGTFYPVCAKNTCLLSGIWPLEGGDIPLSPKFIFTMSTTSKCYETMTRGYCAESYQLRFSSNHFIPQCRYIPAKKAQCPKEEQSQEVRKIRCKPGSRYDYLTKCSRSLNPR